MIVVSIIYGTGLNETCHFYQPIYLSPPMLFLISNITTMPMEENMQFNKQIKFTYIIMYIF